MSRVASIHDIRNHLRSTIDSLKRSILVGRLPRLLWYTKTYFLWFISRRRLSMLRVDEIKLLSCGYKFTDTTKKNTIVRTGLFKRSLTNVEDPLISRILMQNISGFNNCVDVSYDVSKQKMLYKYRSFKVLLKSYNKWRSWKNDTIYYTCCFSYEFDFKIQYLVNLSVLGFPKKIFIKKNIHILNVEFSIKLHVFITYC